MTSYGYSPQQRLQDYSRRRAVGQSGAAADPNALVGQELGRDFSYRQGPRQGAYAGQRPATDGVAAGVGQPAGPSSPVSATGQLQPSGPGIAAGPMPTAPPGPAPAPARTYVSHTQGGSYGVPTDPAARQKFFAGLAPGAQAQGGGTWGHDPAGGGWYVSAAPGGGPGQTAPTTSPWGPWPGQPEGANPPTWQAPDVGTYESQVMTALSRALEQGGSLGPDAVNQLRARAVDDATALAGQAKERYGQSLASRGLTGPYAAAGQRAIDEAMNSDISTGFRDIDLAASDRNFRDQLALTTALGGQMNDMFSRAGLSYGAGRAGAGDVRDNWKTEIQAWLGSQGLENEDDRNALAGELGRGGLVLDRDRLNQGARQFDQDYRLRLAGLLNDRDLGLGNLGYQYTALQGNLLDRIFQGLR